MLDRVNIVGHGSLKPQSLQNKSHSYSIKVFGSISHENHQLAYKYRQLKSVHKIHLAWFYDSTLHVNLVENGPTHKMFHPAYIEKFC